MKKTEENLKAAFAGESQANRKYLAFAKKAEEEGLVNIAKLFRAVAEAETIHAHSHLNILKKIKSTKENLQAAIDGEMYEFTKMYPEFLKVATEEGVQGAIISFRFANEVEKIHEKLYRKALKAVEQRKDIEEENFSVCSVCGYTTSQVPDNCPVCGAEREKFKEI